MKKTAFFLLVIFMVTSGVLIQLSCKKKSDTEVNPIYMQVELPRHELRHDLYYDIHLSERSIELTFSETLDAATVNGNIKLMDQYGELSNYELQQSGNQVLIMFNPEFELKHGWKYDIEIYPGLKSESGLAVSPDKSIECRTGVDYAMQYTATQN